MFIPIDNEPRPYAWGAVGRIAELLGRDASGGPEAELWLGAHPGAPSRILTPGETGGAADLAEWIEREATEALGQDLAPGRRLPFLLKVLAAAAPLSLQAHPTPSQAREGFARENAAGIPLDSPVRNYRDPFHKPELIVAVSETFDALCGFRSADDLAALSSALLTADARLPGPRPDVIAPFARWLREPHGLRRAVVGILGGAEPGPLVDRLVRMADAASTEPETLPVGAVSALRTVRELAAHHPRDPGIAVALLLNRVRLRKGEALYLPAGNVHAYLDGLGIELMAASDNVLRGGLTEKHVDVPELLKVLDFRPLSVSLLHPEEPRAGVRLFRPGVPDFMLAHIDLNTARSVELHMEGPAILLATDGSGTIRDGASTAQLSRARAWFLPPGEAIVEGAGTVFVATTASAKVL